MAWTYAQFRKECERYNIDPDWRAGYVQIQWKMLRKIYLKATKEEKRNAKSE